MHIALDWINRKQKSESTSHVIISMFSIFGSSWKSEEKKCRLSAFSLLVSKRKNYVFYLVESITDTNDR